MVRIGIQQSFQISTETIFDQMEHLNISFSQHGIDSTADSEEFSEESSTSGILNPTIFDNPVNNIALAYFASRTPSPDELIIQQRGRRRITPITNFSPDKKCSAKSPFQVTPTKGSQQQQQQQQTSAMTLRSSPRKRLLVNDIGINEKSTNSDVLTRRCLSGNNWHGTPISKKQKVDEKPMAQQMNIPLHVQLKGLAKDQIIEIISNLVMDEPHLENKIRNNFPMPDISHMEEELLQVKRNIFKSLPTSRLATGSAAYSRVVIHLTSFKKLIVDQSKLLYDSSNWDALVDYVKMAWNYVRATPIWDSNSHNIIRRNCFKALTYNLISSLKFGGIRLGEERLETLERDIKEWSKDYQDVLTCANSLNQLMLKIHTNQI